MKDVFNIIKMNTESVYIPEAKKEKDRRFHHIEVDLVERGLEVYNFKRRKRIIYLETNFDFVDASRVQNNKRIFLTKG